VIEAEETALTGRVWPVHFKPQEDELLSSWLTRLALAHGQTAASFFNQAWPGRYLLARDLDLWNDPATFELLARKTNTLPARAFAPASHRMTGGSSRTGHVRAMPRGCSRAI
jgi:hypothetical protein